MRSSQDGDQRCDQRNQDRANQDDGRNEPPRWPVTLRHGRVSSHCFRMISVKAAMKPAAELIPREERVDPAAPSLAAPIRRNRSHGRFPRHRRRRKAQQDRKRARDHSPHAARAGWGLARCPWPLRARGPLLSAQRIRQRDRMRSRLSATGAEPHSAERTKAPPAPAASPTT